MLWSGLFVDPEGKADEREQRGWRETAPLLFSRRWVLRVAEEERKKSEGFSRGGCWPVEGEKRRRKKIKRGRKIRGDGPGGRKKNKIRPAGDRPGSGVR